MLLLGVDGFLFDLGSGGLNQIDFNFGLWSFLRLEGGLFRSDWGSLKGFLGLGGLYMVQRFDHGWVPDLS